MFTFHMSIQKNLFCYRGKDLGKLPSPTGVNISRVNGTFLEVRGSLILGGTGKWPRNELREEKVIAKYCKVN